MGKSRTEIPELARKIGEEYSYMDDMPLEGWMWEFIRRDPRFKSAFQTIRSCASQHRGEILWPWPQDFQQAYEFFDSIFVFSRPVEFDRKWLRVFCPCIVHFEEFFRGEDYSVQHLYPDPDARFCDFPVPPEYSDSGKRYTFAQTGLGLCIRGAAPFLIKEYSELDESAFSMLPMVKIWVASK